MNYTRLSKTISKALRHKPEQFGIELDQEGWTTLEQLFKALGKRNPEWRDLTEQDLQDMMEAANKKRYEINHGRIRAFYGHSIQQKIHKVAVTPPDVLYHGTPRNIIPILQEEGLKPMSRQYVHLSGDIGTASVVGKRRDRKPAILRVKAREAFEAGISFYVENDQIWLSEPIPAEFIIFPN